MRGHGLSGTQCWRRGAQQRLEGFCGVEQGFSAVVGGAFQAVELVRDHGSWRVAGVEMGVRHPAAASPGRRK